MPWSKPAEHNIRINWLSLRETIGDEKIFPDNIYVFGAIADSVHEVIEIEDKDVEPAPKFGNNISVNYINGIGKKDGEFIIILNIDAIFSSDEIIKLEDLIHNPLLQAQKEEENQEDVASES